jgi:hypothetical protein
MAPFPNDNVARPDAKRTRRSDEESFHRGEHAPAIGETARGIGETHPAIREPTPTLREPTFHREARTPALL